MANSHDQLISSKCISDFELFEYDIEFPWWTSSSVLIQEPTSQGADGSPRVSFLSVPCGICKFLNVGKRNSTKQSRDRSKTRSGPSYAWHYLLVDERDAFPSRLRLSAVTSPQTISHGASESK
jgi:hypothetical protein